jgi:hypothetical protein
LLPQNKRHIRDVAVKGAGVAGLIAGLSLVKFSPLVAFSIMVGAALSLGNVYSIILVAEALTSAARSGVGAGGATKAITAVIYVLKLAVITAVLVVLVVYKLANLFAVLAGFTVVLVVHVFVGLSRFTESPDGEA